MSISSALHKHIYEIKFSVLRACILISSEHSRCFAERFTGGKALWDKVRIQHWLSLWKYWI